MTAKLGAGANERVAERTTCRNGHRERRWDRRLGTLKLQVRKSREGGYVPSFIKHRKRSKRTIISVIREAVLEELDIAGQRAR